MNVVSLVQLFWSARGQFNAYIGTLLIVECGNLHFDFVHCWKRILLITNEFGVNRSVKAFNCRYNCVGDFSNSPSRIAKLLLRLQKTIYF